MPRVSSHQHFTIVISCWNIASLVESEYSPPTVDRLLYLIFNLPRLSVLDHTFPPGGHNMSLDYSSCGVEVALLVRHSVLEETQGLSLLFLDHLIQRKTRESGVVLELGMYCQRL